MSCDSIVVAVLNIQIYRGDTYEHLLTWYDSDDNLIDLTNYTAKMNIVSSLKRTDTPLLTLTSPTQLVLGGVAGTIEINITPTESLIDVERAMYDLEMTSGAGRVETIIQGSFTTVQDKTR